MTLALLMMNLERRGIGAAVRARILRLNPNPQLGFRIRGWHPAPTLKNEYALNCVAGKRQFISRHGRAAWGALPKSAIIRNGKRAYVGCVVYDRGCA